MIKNTGNFRIVRNILGISGDETLVESKSKEDIVIQFNLLDKEEGYKYYKQEEVATTNSLMDESKEYIASMPYWRNF